MEFDCAIGSIRLITVAQLSQATGNKKPGGLASRQVAPGMMVTAR
jgi:hypothetical protein